MSELVLTKTRIQAGIWEGVLIAADPNATPQIEVIHLDQKLDAVVVAPDPESPGRHLVAIPIPVELMTDGVQTFLIQDAETGDKLDSFAVITGEPLEDDIRSEVDLLRAELDMMKKAFRRHCLETM